MFKSLNGWKEEMEGAQGNNSKIRVAYVKTRNLLLLLDQKPVSAAGLLVNRTSTPF